MHAHSVAAHTLACTYIYTQTGTHMHTPLRRELHVEATHRDKAKPQFLGHLWYFSYLGQFSAYKW